MARQISPLVKLHGSIDQLSFFKTKDGYMAQEKGGVSGDKIKTDPRFRNTRLQGIEFAAGCKAGKCYRLAFGDEFDKVSDNRVISRLSQAMMKIVKSDPVNNFGDRRVDYGNAALLVDFNTNKSMPLTAVFKKEIKATINRTTGQVTINIPEVVPIQNIAAPSGVTHYRYFAAAAAINFPNRTYTTVRQSEPYAPYSTPAGNKVLDLALPANSQDTLFVMLGIEFAFDVNGNMNPLHKSQSTLAVIAADYIPQI